MADSLVSRFGCYTIIWDTTGLARAAGSSWTSGTCGDTATSEQRAEIAQNLFSAVRVLSVEVT